MTKDKILHIMFIGKHNVGKSKLIKIITKQFIDNDLFNKQEYEYTIGYDIKFIKMKSLQSKLILYDIGGHERFEFIIATIITKINIVFIISDGTLLGFDKYINILKVFKYTGYVILAYFINPSDMVSYNITNHDKSEYLKKNMLLYSLTDNDSIRQLFKQIITNIELSQCSNIPTKFTITGKFNSTYEIVKIKHALGLPYSNDKLNELLLYEADSEIEDKTDIKKLRYNNECCLFKM